MIEDQLVQGGIISIGDKLLGLVVIEGPDFFDQAQEGAPTIVQMGEPMLYFGGPKRVDIEADILAFFSIAVALERANLGERKTQIGAAKGFILIKLQTVLIVQMERPKFAEGHCKIDFIGWIQAGQDGVGGLNQTADTFGVAG